MNALRILLIEDEARLANSVRQGLVEEDFAVEVAANALVRLGLPADRVRTERFGPSGT